MAADVSGRHAQLVDAVKSGDVAATRRAIDAGAEINELDVDGWTALNWAAGKGDLELVTVLVSRGADITKTGRDLRTPYEIALAAGRTEVVRYLQTIGGDAREPGRTYCRAYRLVQLRPFAAANAFSGADDDIMFVHQDYAVTKTMWRDGTVVFHGNDTGWKRFCTDVLDFKVPSDLDLIASAQ